MSSMLERRKVLKAAVAGAATAAAGPWFIKDLYAADEIKIAGIHDASGGLDLLGRPMIDVLTMAVEEANAAGGLLGKQIKLINYDAQSNIQYYTQYATQAATKDKVAVVHAGITSASREAIRPVLKRFNTLYFYNTLYEGGVCDRNCFCTGSTPAQTVEKLIPFAMKKFNGKKIYVLAADYNYGQITSKWVKKYTQDNGGTIAAIDFFPLDVTDFGPTIKKIQAAKPDIIMSVLVGGSHISFYRQWAASGMKKQIPMASTTFGLGNEHVVVSAEEGDGILASYAYFHEVATPSNQEFITRYHKRFGDKAAPLTEVAAMTWHGFQLWAQGVKKAGTIDRMKVIEALEGGMSYEGPAGKSTIDAATHHDILDVYIGEADNKKFKLLQSFSQQKPADTAAVCDLKKNPKDNQQYIIDVKV